MHKHGGDVLTAPPRRRHRKILGTTNSRYLNEWLGFICVPPERWGKASVSIGLETVPLGHHLPEVADDRLRLRHFTALRGARAAVPQRAASDKHVKDVQ